jgi:hypothetical protein
LAAALPPMVLPAAERTTQVLSAGVAGMREKANPAVRTVGDVTAKLAVGPQDRVQRGLILPDQRPGAIVPMPIRAKREKLLDGDDKKARLSVIISMLLDTPSSYHLDANASRGRARLFSARWTRMHTNRPRKRSAMYRSAKPFRLPSRRSFATRQILNRLLGKKEALFFLPSSGKLT